jgi:predicted RNA polymerase sigma factor
LSIAPGDIYALLGLGGAGKTTAIRMLLGMIRPTSGDATLFGTPIRRAGAEVWARTGSRRLADVWRADAARRRREMLAAQHEPATPAQVSDVDDSLLLLFLCCHPSLAASSAIPLTLRAVGGLTTAEIARAFLIPEPAMGKRISRAKQRIKDSAIPLRMPAPGEWPQRLRSVLHVIYLMFNEGYAVSAGWAPLPLDQCR